MELQELELLVLTIKEKLKGAEELIRFQQKQIEQLQKTVDKMDKELNKSRIWQILKRM